MSNKPNPLAAEINEARKPKRDMSLPTRQEITDEDIEIRSRTIGEKWGSSTQITQADVPVLPERPPPRQVEMVSVRFDFPAYVDEQLAVKAASTRGPSGGKITKTYLALKALKDAGYRVEDEDLIEDRRRTRK